MQERYGQSPTIYLHGSGNYRNDIFPDYKISRVGLTPPVLYPDVVDYLCDVWGAEKCDGIETDDILAIEQSKHPLGESVIASIDKDLYQVPGLHYDMVKHEEYRYTPRQSDTFLYQQIITGDRTDDIPGVHGIGPVKAKEALEGASSTYELYSRALDCWGGDTDAMHLTAQLVYLLRSENDSYLNRKEVANA